MLVFHPPAITCFSYTKKKLVLSTQFPLDRRSAVLDFERSCPTVPLARQLVDQGFTFLGPLVQEKVTLSFQTPKEDRIRTVSQRTKPNSRHLTTCFSTCHGLYLRVFIYHRIFPSSRSSPGALHRTPNVSLFPLILQTALPIPWIHKHWGTPRPQGNLQPSLESAPAGIESTQPTQLLHTRSNGTWPIERGTVCKWIGISWGAFPGEFTGSALFFLG